MPRDADELDMPEPLPDEAYATLSEFEPETISMDSLAQSALEIARAAAMAPIEYDRQREAIADRLGIRPEVLDREVADARRAVGLRPGAGTELRVQDIKTPDDAVAYFNAKHSVVFEGGKTVVFLSRTDDILHRHVFDRVTFEDLRKLYCNRTVEVENEESKKPDHVPIANIWLKSTQRAEYLGGVVFDPTDQHGADVLNLWRGFAVKPKPGSWQKMKEHIETVICKGDRVKFDYLIGWMARLFQFPAERAEVAVVIRGKEGTGKGTLANAIKRVFGQHGMSISNAKHLTGNFNSHLQDCVFLFADEALFAGDKAHVGVLKSIITEPTLTIEGKYRNPVETPNFLHLMMASNEGWVIPAGLEARRFFVLETSDDHIEDFPYFAAIQSEMTNGGYAAMLHDLLHYDLAGFDIRNAPKTAELGEQKKLSLPTTEAWWLDVLQRGYVFRSKIGLENIFGEWMEDVTTELLFTSYAEFAKGIGERHPVTREAIGKWLTKHGAHSSRPRNAIVGEHITNGGAYGDSRIAAPIVRERAWGYRLGALDAARRGFEVETGLKFDWGVCDE